MNRTIFNYLNSSDPELQSLTIGLLNSDEKVKNYISYTCGYKFEYIINYYFDTICNIDDKIVKEAYFNIVKDVIWDIKDNITTKRSILDVLTRRKYFNLSGPKYKWDLVNSYESLILLDLLRYTKFYRKHSRRRICISKESNKFITLEDIIRRIHYGLIDHFYINSDLLEYCFNFLEKFRNDNQRNNRQFRNKQFRKK